MIDFVLYFLCYQYPHFSVTRYSTRRRQTVRMLAASDIHPAALMLLTLCPLVVLMSLISPCGLRGCKNGPTPFPGWMSYKATKPGLVLSVIYLSMFYVLFIIWAPFYVLLVFVAMCSVFWLFWLSYQYLPSDWPERLL